MADIYLLAVDPAHWSHTQDASHTAHPSHTPLLLTSQTIPAHCLGPALLIVFLCALCLGYCHTVRKPRAYSLSSEIINLWEIALEYLGRSQKYCLRSKVGVATTNTTAALPALPRTVMTRPEPPWCGTAGVRFAYEDQWSRNVHTVYANKHAINICCRSCFWLNLMCPSEAGSWECEWSVGGFITSVWWQEYFTWKGWGFIRPARGCDAPKGLSPNASAILSSPLSTVCISKPLIKMIASSLPFAPQTQTLWHGPLWLQLLWRNELSVWKGDSAI